MRPFFTSRSARCCASTLLSLTRPSYSSRLFSVIPGDHMLEGIGLPPSAHSLTLPGPVPLEYGGVLPSVTLGYNTYGRLAADGRNAVLVGHSLTSNSAVHEWWGELLGPGPGYMLDTDRFFVVCVNYLGSVYGSSGPLSLCPQRSVPYSGDFPVATLKDNVAVQRALLAALGVQHVALAMGGSLGGMLALEYAATAPEEVGALCVVGSCGVHPDWAIGFGEAGRQAIQADPHWASGYYGRAGTPPPLAGMGVARQLAMLSYRTPQSLSEKFGRGKVEGGRAAQAQAQHVAPFYQVESYLNYQGDKFKRRFDPLAYVRLTQLLDSHDLGRGREGGDFAAALARLRQQALVVGIDSDLLYPFELSAQMASLIPNSELHTISSPHGHDSFLIEIEALNKACVEWRDRAMPAAEESSEMALLRHSKWGVTKGRGLRKLFEFRDARALDTFKLRLADLRGQREAGVAVTLAAPSHSVTITLASLEEVAMAMAIDDCAAELQLGGKWN